MILEELLYQKLILLILRTAQTALQLLARITGNRSRMVNQSENPADTTSCC
jgi:hypothetical protein